MDHVVARHTLAAVPHAVHDIRRMKNHRASANAIRDAALHDFNCPLFHDDEFLFGILMRRVASLAIVQSGDVTFQFIQCSCRRLEELPALAALRLPHLEFAHGEILPR